MSRYRSSVGGVYVCRKGYQPVVVGIDDGGNLIWESRMKEPWQLKMFPVKYGGDFSNQWMWKSLQEKGLDWEPEDNQ